MRRRAFLSGASVVAASVLRPAVAQTEPDYEETKDPLPPDLQLYGTNPATEKEADKARQILEGASAHSTSLLAVAQYVEGLSLRNDDGEAYNAQWKVRWNPVIVGFYQPGKVSQKLAYQEGDTIPWCAAFLAWALKESGYNEKVNASSGSFRNIGTSSTSPAPGDIVVFKSANPKLAEIGRGHVGIFVSEVTGGFRILGGNQKAGKKFSSVNTTFFPREDDNLKFHSVRSLASFARA